MKSKSPTITLGNKYASPYFSYNLHRIGLKYLPFFKQLLLILFITTVTSSCSKEEIEPSIQLKGTVNTVMESEMFDLVNQHRQSIGLTPLIYCDVTHYYATQHSNYMLAQKALSHDNFKSRAAAISSETNAVMVAENVAHQFKKPRQTLKKWLASEAHKNTIEGDFTHSAVGVVEDKTGKPYYTQIFYRL